MIVHFSCGLADTCVEMYLYRYPQGFHSLVTESPVAIAEAQALDTKRKEYDSIPLLVL